MDAMVRTLVADRLIFFAQVLSAVTISFTLGLILPWRLAIVVIAMQPLIVGAFFGKAVMVKNMSKKVLEAQNSSSELASEAVGNHRTISTFLLFWVLRKRVKSNLERVIAETGGMTADLSKGTNALKAIFLILVRKSEVGPNDPNGIKPEKINGDIELKDVDFAYPARPKQLIFTGLSLKVEAGKIMALVGQSGSGKSTIIRFVERFSDPLKGSVEIDGIDIKSYNLRSLRSHIALVSQEPTLFADTIHENIVYGKENATEAEIIKAATLANAHEFIRGVQLSGGQKQRIALARAILKNPVILLLDEATSALDSKSESLVQDALEKMMVGRTCIVVAHRLSTIHNSDSIAVIENGKVVEERSHDELLTNGEMVHTTALSNFSNMKAQNN
ncbi:hypothetical protein GIB67_027763 [Kingdonia uniflora]|uniref:Uncharacterized protein n=1 Tax=Kingdonia uniflora TaxID=39325 RepID=A0A7J7PC94_9MAGN|nr:hypothetical protein GIB67_027763 [Kingdonia uniflora]